MPSLFRCLHFLCLTIQISLLVSAQKPITECGNLKLKPFPDFEILSIFGWKRYNVSTPALPSMNLKEAKGLNICDVLISLTHPKAKDKDNVLVRVWLPLENWNGRFLGAGGGAFYASLFDFEFGQAVARGYATAGTDAGLLTNATEDLNRGKWVLKQNREIHFDNLHNFIHRSVHDMATVGKAITEAFYGAPPKYSYWVGCSTGGRQGYTEAQRYPTDFNGIVAIAPSINTPSLSAGTFWPQIIMNELDTHPLNCIFQKFFDEMVKACDGLDGVEDKILVDPSACKYNPDKVVGMTATCDNGPKIVTAKEAEVVRRILGGPRTASGDLLWYSISPGTPFWGSARTEVRSGKVVGIPFSTAEAWYRYFLKKDPTYDPNTVTFSDAVDFFRQSNAEYGEIYGASNPDLSAFKEAGGKLLTWHGVSDEIVPYEGTVRYRKEQERKLGNTTMLDDFYRIFFAPGVQHCGEGPGPVPIDPLEAVVAWVEEGKAPDTLPATTTRPDGTVVARDLCLFPKVWQYKGKGDPNIKESWTCSVNTTCGPICGNLRSNYN